MSDFSQFVPAYIRRLAEGDQSRPLKQSSGDAKPIALNLNENPFGPSPLALKAIEAALSDIHRYPEIQATELHEAIAAFHGVQARSSTGHSRSDRTALHSRESSACARTERHHQRPLLHRVQAGHAGHRRQADRSSDARQRLRPRRHRQQQSTRTRESYSSQIPTIRPAPWSPRMKWTLSSRKYPSMCWLSWTKLTATSPKISRAPAALFTRDPSTTRARTET